MIRRMRFAYYINKATDTHSEYLLHIDSQRQQWFRERASMSRYMYIAPLDLFIDVIDLITQLITTENTKKMYEHTSSILM